MSVLKPLYCCIAHRDENLSTINLIGFLSKAYQQVVTLLKAQTGLMRQCRQSQLKNINSMLSSQEHQIEDMGVLSEKLQSLMEDMGKYMDQSFFQNIIVPDQNESKLNATDLGMTSFESIISETGNMEENEVSKSPVFKKKKSRRGGQFPQYPGYRNSTDKIQSKSNAKNDQLEKNNESKDQINQKSPPAPVIADQCLHNSPGLDESQMDIIENTPVTKTYKKIGISSLFNVDTIVLPTGKRLKQTMITLTPNSSNRKSPVNKKSVNSKTPLQLSASSNKGNGYKSLENSIIGESDDALEEEIVEDSPKCAQLQSHTKYKLKSPKCSLKNKTKSFASTNENREPNKVKKRPKNKQSLSSMAQNTKTISLSSQRMLSTRKVSDALVKKKSSDNKLISEVNAESDQLLLDAGSSPIPFDIENSIDKDVKHVDIRTTENEKIKGNTSNILHSKRKLSNSPEYPASSQDDTYFAPMEKKVMRNVPYKIDLRDSQDNREDRHLDLGFPSTKRNLLSSFDIVPPKDEPRFPPAKPGRTKAERVKIPGIECWECKLYYEGLGLSEEEIKTRKNACSRHRSKFGERPETPEGMWDCVFPDTHSSTLAGS